MGVGKVTVLGVDVQGPLGTPSSVFERTRWESRRLPPTESCWCLRLVGPFLGGTRRGSYKIENNLLVHVRVRLLRPVLFLGPSAAYHGPCRRLALTGGIQGFCADHTYSDVTTLGGEADDVNISPTKSRSTKLPTSVEAGFTTTPSSWVVGVCPSRHRAEAPTS